MQTDFFQWKEKETNPKKYFIFRIMVFLRIVGFYLSGFVMVVISVDRFYAILYPISHR